jgi:hypothetical protein
MIGFIGALVDLAYLALCFFGSFAEIYHGCLSLEL